MHVANLGGWIGRKLADGEPLAILAAILIPVAFVVLYRLLVWLRTN